MAVREFRICRRIEIDAAHRVPDHKSKCYNLHGHRYVIEAELTGTLFKEGAQTGMVMDFGFIKDIMVREIHEPCDHGLILSKDDLGMLQLVAKPSAKHWAPYRGVKLYLLDVSPTAENLAEHWYMRLRTAVDKYLCTLELDAPMPKVTAIHVWETPNCVATFPASLYVDPVMETLKGYDLSALSK